MPSKKPPKIREIQSLRGLAIILVMGYHLLIRWAPPYFSMNLYVFNWQAHSSPLIAGWSGVELFFMISGFVIAKSLETSRDTFEFIFKRYARLFPALALIIPLEYLLLSTLRVGPDYPADMWSVFPSVLVVDPALLSASGILHETKWITGVLWSLWVEVQFYFLAAALYFGFNRRHFSTSLQFLCFPALLITGYLHFAAIDSSTGVRSIFALAPYLVWFSAGATFADVSSRGLRKWSTLILLAHLLASMGLLAAMSANNPRPALTALWAGLLNVIYFAAFIQIIMRGRKSRLLNNRIFELTGNSSYELYLMHELVLMALSSYLLGSDLNASARKLLFVGSVIGVGVLSNILSSRLSIPMTSWLTSGYRARFPREE